MYAATDTHIFSVGGLNQPASLGFSEVCEVYDIAKGNAPLPDTVAEGSAPLPDTVAGGNAPLRDSCWGSAPLCDSVAGVNAPLPDTVAEGNAPLPDTVAEGTAPLRDSCWGNAPLCDSVAGVNAPLLDTVAEGNAPHLHPSSPLVFWASQPSFTPSLSQCHLTTELYSRPLKSSYFEVYTDTTFKYVWYNSFSFHATTKPFHAKITQNITFCTVHTQKVRNIYQYCEVLLFFSTKQHIYITTSIYLLQEVLI